jgi:hypothetical protein
MSYQSSELHAETPSTPTRSDTMDSTQSSSQKRANRKSVDIPPNYVSSLVSNSSVEEKKADSPLQPPTTSKRAHRKSINAPSEVLNAINNETSAQPSPKVENKTSSSPSVDEKKGETRERSKSAKGNNSML